MKSSAIKVCLIFFALFLCNCADNSPLKVVIVTDYGDIELELYDKTPQHRDNFIKLMKEGYYDGTLFHRVIKQYMIQGGDPDSKNARLGTKLGTGGPKYTIPAEIIPEYIHQRGALAAARQRDNVNPTKASSGSQFYIVLGKVYTDEELNKVETQIGNDNARAMYVKYIKEEEEKGDKTIHPDSIMMRSARKAGAYLRDNPYHIKEENREVYKTVGGTPLLDGEYTVFGRVTKGMDIVERIAELETDDNDRPKINVRIKRIRNAY